MTGEFKRAVDRVISDFRIEPVGAAELVAVGVQRKDCLEFLERMLEGERVTPEFLAVIVQWAVAVGVQIERARWEDHQHG